MGRFDPYLKRQINRIETMKYLITGGAGFIGFHLCKALLEKGEAVTTIDNLNDYYDVELKKSRLDQLVKNKNFRFHHSDIFHREQLFNIFKDSEPERVIHLAAQAGVRYSLQNPYSYVDSNLVGFVNMLEACRQGKIEHFVFASSSSVYGTNSKVPFSVADPVEKPISLYAATKRANELIAYTYSHLYNIPVTGLRFFTVYGPWGRPDMAYYSFTKSIFEETPINVFNGGRMRRDFTYIDDIVEGVIRVSNLIPGGNETDPTRYKIYNIGHNKPIELSYFIEVLESTISKKAIKQYSPIQPGDVPQTFADIDDLIEDTGFAPKVSIEEGLMNFVDWYRQYHNA